MASKWDNFLANLGEWRGSFTTITAAGLLQQPSPSVLTLARGEGDGHVRFTLQRWSPGTEVAPGGGPVEGAGEPGRDIQQDYRSLGNQVVFLTQEPSTRVPCRWRRTRYLAVNSASLGATGATG